MDNRLGLPLKILFIVLATHTAYAEGETITPGDGDEYLPQGAVLEIQELDAMRRHVKDIKFLLVFGIGFIGGCLVVSRVI